MLARLKRRGAPEEVASALLDDLIARGHVDDAVFAQAWVQGRGTRGYGPARLRAELGRRGVAAPLIEAAMRALAPDRQREQARAMAERRYPALLRAAPLRAAARLRDHLLRRGFSGALVQTIVREVTTVTRERD